MLRMLKNPNCLVMVIRSHRAKEIKTEIAEYGTVSRNSRQFALCVTSGSGETG
jgi:hypothetical protein